MKSRLLITCCVGLLLLLTVLPGASLAVVPHEVNYQGYLTDSVGKAVPDGNYNISFAIYDDPTEGNVLWGESQTVTVTNGIYNVILGQPGNKLYPHHFDGDRYLGVSVDTDDEMTPRQKITSTAFTLKAQEAENADTLDGRDSTEFSETTHSHSFSDISGTATDAQVPDSITINHASTADSAATAAHADSADTAATAAHATIAGNAATADDADMVDGQHASAFASSTHTHDGRYYTESEVNSLVAGLQSQITSLQTSVTQLTTLLENVTRVGNDITISGANLHIVNGTHTTDGTPNGLGNLIVGYNEERGDPFPFRSGDPMGLFDNRTGSHNIVVGSCLNYSSYGGLVVGYYNQISGPYSSVSGGDYNNASGAHVSVSGGKLNTASGAHASVSGGSFNEASGDYASVSGGESNSAIGHKTSILGGKNNSTIPFICVLGDPNSGSEYANVSGGIDNWAGAVGASVSGGQNNSAKGSYSSITGGGSDNSAYGNEAFGEYSSIHGGDDNETGYSSNGSSILGGRRNMTSGAVSTISGGVDNSAEGTASSVSGGNSRNASGTYDWVAGSLWQDQ